MHAVTCRTVTISQSVFATRFANWHRSLPNQSNFCSENYRLALNDEKRPGFRCLSSLRFVKLIFKRIRNRIRSVIEMSKIGRVTSNSCNGKTVSRTKNFRRKAHRSTCRYKMECINRTKNTCHNL